MLFGFVQVFNPHSPSIFYGLLGMKLYFYYIPLMFVGYAMLRTEDDLRRFLVVSMTLAAVIASVGIIQSIVGVNFLNPHGGADIDELSHLVRYTPSGIAVLRPPSVFVSEGRFGAYLVVIFILGLGTAGYLLLRSKRGRIIVFPALALVVVAVILLGSRGGFLYAGASALVLSAGMLWGAPESRLGGYRLLKAIRRGFTFVALALSLAVILFPDVVGARWAFYRETLSPNSESFEAGGRVWDYPVGELQKALADPNWATGEGIGTASLGAQYVARILEVPVPNISWVENGYGNLIVEFGILGPILWLIWASSLVFAALKITLSLKGTWAFPVALSILWFEFLLLFPFTWGGIVQYQNFVSNAYFWLMVGVMFRLPGLVNESPDDVGVTPAPAI